MRVAALTIILLGFGWTGCKTDTCTAVKIKLAGCTSAEGVSFDEINKACSAGLPEMKPMFEDCAATKTCDELHGCFDRHGCQLILTSATDREPSLMCDIKTGP